MQNYKDLKVYEEYEIKGDLISLLNKVGVNL
jgi:hypothetical protein